MVLFFNMLDVAEVAAFIIWISLNPDWSFNDQQGRCRKFLKQLGQELTNDYIQGCLQTKTVWNEMWEMPWKGLES